MTGSPAGWTVRAVRTWDGIQDRGWEPHLFAGPVWQSVWWERVGRGTPSIRIVEGGEEPVAYLPLHRVRGVAPGVRRYRGAGRGWANLFDLAFRPGTEVSAAFRTAIEGLRREGAFVLELAGLGEAFPTWRAITALGGDPAWAVRTFREHPCPVADLDPDWDRFFRSALSRKRRAEMRRYERDAAGLGRIDLAVIERPEEVEAWSGGMTGLLAEIERLHAKRFAGEVHRLRTARGRGFVAGIVERCLGHGLHLSMLCCDGVPVSFLLGVRAGDRFVDCVPAFDPDLARYGIGHLHLMRLMRRLAAEGVRIFDFSWGEAIYKRKWATRTEWTHVALLAPADSLGARLALAVAALPQRMLRRARDRGWTAGARRLLGRLRRFRSG